MNPRHLCLTHPKAFSECIGAVDWMYMRWNLPTGCIHDWGHKMQDLLLKISAAARFVLDRTEGQGLTEYAMAVVLIAFGCVAGEAAVATSVNHVFVTLGTTILNGVIQ